MALECPSFLLCASQAPDFVNRESRYSLIAEDILKSDLKLFNVFFRARLAEQLVYEALISSSDLTVLGEMVDPVQLLSTNNRL